MSELEEKLIESRPVYAGKIIKVRQDRVRLPNGKEAVRDVVEHPGAVAIVPVTMDGRYILVRQYRYPIGQVLLEVPAGKLERGEDPETCARRELEEETGFQAGKLTKLATFCTTPGFSDEMLHLYLAQELKSTAQNLDNDEFIDIEYYTVESLRTMLRDQVIRDAKTLVGLLLAGCGNG